MKLGTVVIIFYPQTVFCLTAGTHTEIDLSQEVQLDTKYTNDLKEAKRKSAAQRNFLNEKYRKFRFEIYIRTSDE